MTALLEVHDADPEAFKVAFNLADTVKDEITNSEDETGENSEEKQELHGFLTLAFGDVDSEKTMGCELAGDFTKEVHPMLPQRFCNSGGCKKYDAECSEPRWQSQDPLR